MRTSRLTVSLALLLASSCAVIAVPSAANERQTSTAGVEPIKSRPIRVITDSAPSICESLGNARVENLGCSEAADLIEQLKQAQKDLAAGKELYFEILSGAFASSPMTRTSPREAFLKMRFEKPSTVERAKSDTRLFRPHRLSYAAGSHRYGVTKLVPFYWEVEVALGFEGRIVRVEMAFKPAPPF